jgi:hypothetical protein
MEQNMKVIGKKTNRTAKELNHGLMELLMKATINKEKNAELVNSSGLMDQSMMANFLIIT